MRVCFIIVCVRVHVCVYGRYVVYNLQLKIIFLYCLERTGAFSRELKPMRAPVSGRGQRQGNLFPFQTEARTAVEADFKTVVKYYGIMNCKLYKNYLTRPL